jgi:hypothetical protein
VSLSNAPECLLVVVLSKHANPFSDNIAEIQKKIIKIAGRGYEIKTDLVAKKQAELFSYFSDFNKKKGYMSKPWV